MSKKKEDWLYQSLSRTRIEAGKKVIEFIDLNIFRHLFQKSTPLFINFWFKPVDFVCLFIVLFTCFCVLYITDLEHLNMFYILVLKFNLTLTNFNYSAVVLFYFSFVIFKCLFQLLNLTFVRI